MSSITVSGVAKSFGTVDVLKDFSASFEDGEFVTILGPSGCGKTTMLRIIAGFERPSSGSVSIDGKTVSDSSVFVPPEKRGIGMVFQSYAVWPHMTVFDNIAYPLKIKKLPKDYITQKVRQILETVHLEQYADRIPSQLSGGQQQRVALGRALIAEPGLLLLDEPLSNLDAKLRDSMRYEIKEIQRNLGITVVYVTHDRVEAMTMSDKIIVMDRGEILQIGSPTEIYKNPANRFVADFVGRVNFIAAEAREGKIILSSGETLPYSGKILGEVTLAVRPENIRISREGENGIKGLLEEKFYLGDVLDCRVRAGNDVIRLNAPPYSYDTLQTGTEINLIIDEYLIYPGR